MGKDKWLTWNACLDLQRLGNISVLAHDQIPGAFQASVVFSRQGDPTLDEHNWI